MRSRSVGLGVGTDRKGTQVSLLGVIKMFYILLIVVICVYIFVTSHQNTCPEVGTPYCIDILCL